MARQPLVKVTYTIEGLREVEEFYRQLPRQFANRAMRSALSRATTVVVREVRKRVPVDKGITKRSIARKIVTWKRKQGFTAIIGVDTGKLRSKPGNLVKLDPKTANWKWLRPLNIADLLEKGTKFAAPHPFLRPAYDATRAEVETVMGNALAEGVLREVKKYEAHRLKKIARRKSPQFALSPAG